MMGGYGGGYGMMAPMGMKGFGKGNMENDKEEDPDALSLSGLLNVLDGVVDSPGRILVMTSNHPDKLDPALIRPGRINKRIHLGYLDGTSVCSMVEHYMLVALSAAERVTFTALA